MLTEQTKERAREFAKSLGDITDADRKEIVNVMFGEDYCHNCGSDSCGGWCTYDSHYEPGDE